MLDTVDFTVRLREIIAAHQGIEGPLLPILHAVQHEWGHIPEPAIPIIAEGLNLGRAEVWGVVTFYHDFRREPAGKVVLKLCAAEACQAQGGRALGRDVLKGLGLADFGTTPDGKVTVERTFCLGLCACGPSAMIGDRPIGHARAETLCQEALS